MMIDRDFVEDPLWAMSLLKRENQFAKYLIALYCFWRRGLSELIKNALSSEFCEFVALYNKYSVSIGGIA